MRIITGDLKGRVIPFDPKSFGDARTTGARVKEALFAMIGADLRGLRFLDLFAGSGQIGLEACSRGASVVFNEPDAHRRALLENLFSEWGLVDGVELLAMSADTAIRSTSDFDIVFLDPPYRAREDDESLASIALRSVDGNPGVLRPRAVAIVQHDPNTELPSELVSLEVEKTKRYGDTALTVYRKTE